MAAMAVHIGDVQNKMILTIDELSELSNELRVNGEDQINEPKM